MHAPSDVRFALNGACSVFAASVGIDDEVGPGGRAVFQIWADGVKNFDSGPDERQHAPERHQRQRDSGQNELAVIMTNGGDGNCGDQADWADARVTCGAVDVTPPTVIDDDAAGRRDGSCDNANVTATFSEAMTRRR